MIGQDEEAPKDFKLAEAMKQLLKDSLLNCNIARPNLALSSEIQTAWPNYCSAKGTTTPSLLKGRASDNALCSGRISAPQSA